MNTPGLTTDFSLVLGGPLYQLFRGMHLADDTLHCSAGACSCWCC